MSHDRISFSQSSWIMNLTLHYHKFSISSHKLTFQCEIRTLWTKLTTDNDSLFFPIAGPKILKHSCHSILSQCSDFTLKFKLVYLLETEKLRGPAGLDSVFCIMYENSMITGLTLVIDNQEYIYTWRIWSWQVNALPYLKLLASWIVWQLEIKAASKSDMTCGNEGNTHSNLSDFNCKFTRPKKEHCLRNRGADF